MSEFQITGDQSINVGGGQFTLVIATYANLEVTRVVGVDYLGMSAKPKDPRVMGGTNEAVLTFNAKFQGQGEVHVKQSGVSYETNMPVEEITYKVHINIR